MKPRRSGWRRRLSSGVSANRRRIGIAALALLAAVTVLVIDATGGAHSPLSSVRNGLGVIASPIGNAARVVVSPIADLGGYFHSNSSLRSDVDRLESENARLRGEAALTQLEKSRIEEVHQLTGLATSTGYTLVAARVIAIGPAQSFAHTVTIDAGTSAGVHDDMTVVDSGGLIGRVVAASAHSATVLLITDPSVVVGARLGTNRHLGTVRGTSADDTVTFTLSGAGASAEPGATLTTWGSPHGIPYVAGIPIGTVESVTSNPRELSIEAKVRPFADFGALDLVGVVVPATTQADRPLIHGAG